MSDEHLWSNWMKDLLPKGSNYIEEMHEYEAVPQQRVRNVKRRSRQGAAQTKKIPVVCQACNSGWMEKLDFREASPILAPMIKGQFVVLNEAARRVVARWIALKVIVYEHSHTAGQPQSALHTDKERRIFKDHAVIPDRFQIWIGHAGHFGEWGARISRFTGGLNIVHSPDPPIADLLPPITGTNTQTITWGIGHLRVFSITTTNPTIDKGLTIRPAAFLPLWPLGGGDIVWPPSYAVTDTTMFNLTQQFVELTATGPHWAGTDPGGSRIA